MSIKLFTGLPGAGKSLSLVDALRTMHEREPGRPVYVHGIDGLKDGLALPCENPFNWEDLPDGSIVVVDEAQKVWPSRRSGDPHPKVRAFSEHRHRGFDFLLATQSPAYLDPYLRGLVEQHTHVVRRWGGQTVDRYVWEELCEDVKSTGMRARAQRQKWKYPKACFDMYKSSSLHTVKRRIPKQYYIIIAGFTLAPLLGWYAWHLIRGLGGNQEKAAQVAAVASSGPAGEVKKAGSFTNVYGSPEEYVKAHLPRIANQPWSAPVFDQQPVVAKPDLLCIEHENPNVAGEMLCTCYTEQVTPYELHSLRECRTYARHGVYNPRRMPLQQRDGSGSQQVAEKRGSQQGDAAGHLPSVGEAGRPWPRSNSRVSSPYVPPELTRITH